MERCKECDSENRPDAIFCTVCGSQLLAAQANRNIRLLFFLTPMAFLLMGVLVAIELGMANPFEEGMNIGLFFAAFFIGVGGGFWFCCNLFSLPIEASMPWKSGMFGVVQIVGAIVAAHPLLEFFELKHNNNVRIFQELPLTVGLIFVIYLPAVLAGLSALISRIAMNRKKQIGKVLISASDTAGSGERMVDELIIERPSKPTHSVFRLFADYGLIASIAVPYLISALLLLSMGAPTRNLVLARMASEVGLADTALRLINKALDGRESFPPANYLKAILLLRTSRSEEALAEAQKQMNMAAANQPENVWFHYGLSIVEQHAGRPIQAVEAMERAVAVTPDDPQLWGHLGDLYMNARNREKAAEAYQKSLELEPSDPRIMNNLAYVLLELDRELGRALELARESVRIRPGRFYSADTLAWALHKNGMTSEAFRVLEPVKQSIGTMSAEVNFHFAVICHELGLIKDPRKIYREMLLEPRVNADYFLSKAIERELSRIELELEKDKTGSDDAPGVSENGEAETDFEQDVEHEE